MAQFDCTDDSSSIMDYLHSWFGDGHPVIHLISQLQTTKTRGPLSAGFSLDTNPAQDIEGFDESSDFLNQLEDCSPPTDIASAIRSVSLMCTLDSKRMHCAHVPMLFSVPRVEEDDPNLCPLDDQDKSTEGAADAAEEEVLSVSFQSKYIPFFPLYQDYCVQAVKAELHSLSEIFDPELIIPQRLQGLQSPSTAHFGSGARCTQLNPFGATPSSPLLHPVRGTPCTLWQDLEEVKASGLLSSLTTRGIRLQESMFELIGSEASYLRSLGVAVNHFYASKALKQTVTPMEHHVLFSNIGLIMAASEKFLKDLEIRLGDNVLIAQVGDIVLQHCPEFHSLYVPYVTDMMYQETLVNQLLQHNRHFLCSIKKLESDPVCQRRGLKSFLVLPFQRITRIKLILEHILKLTEPGSDSVSNLQKAIEANHEIVMDCDKGVHKKKQIEKLIYLQMLLDFGNVEAIPLVINGRFLVHQGPVKQLTVGATYNSRVSFISIYLHLFNDLLIMSLPKCSSRYQSFTVVDHAEFPTHVHVKHVKTEALGLPPDSFLLHLSRSHTGHPTAVILVAHTRSDKVVWVQLLSSKQ
ncbi:rho guanine nucleotide exchange factor 19 [Cottoperca gobio]|uniref:Rho guanine nucleotide exchange factor 19 n=1 Tax=Cottoperca gobio TaxID=56716 RepID=A0A6J2PT91_COTGO|nr:rho guanine nucleotide exchange factor 19-like [Cottoperca gobio]